MSVLNKITTFSLIGFMLLFISTVSAGELSVKQSRINLLSIEKLDVNELIIKFKENTTPSKQVEILISHNLAIVHQLPGRDWLRLRLPPLVIADSLLSELTNMPEVEYAEPNYRVYAQFIPNDTYYSYQWNFDQVNMETAWDSSTGMGTVIAVVDTGIAYENYSKYKKASDLAGTSFVSGYDFVNNDNHPNDDEGHGTHVAGTIAQTTNNNKGVAGIAYGASLMPVKVLDSGGSGYTSDVAAGIEWAADHGAQVINLSLGSSSYSQTLADAVAYAANKGVVIVAAAGNDGKNGVIYPAALNDHVIAVGAVRHDEQRTSYSNYGSSLDVVAPGGDLSVDQNSDGYGDGILQQTLQQNWWGVDTRNFGYYFYEGTSMATPHVSGIAALLIANGLTGQTEVRKVIEETARDKGTFGRDDYYGYGLVDAASALAWSSVPNNPPVADANGPYSGDEDSIIIFDGSGSYDLDGDILTYSWDFGDGNIGSGVNPAHAYNSGGIYVVTLTVSDNKDSDVATATASITEVNDPPIAVAGDEIIVTIGEEVTFDGSGSYDSDGSIVDYEWDFGDSSIGNGVVVAHTFTNIGVYLVTLTVTDNNGLTDQDILEVTVQEESVEPQLDVNAQTTNKNRNIKDIFRRWERVYLLTDVLADNESVAGANVKIKVYKPNGSLKRTRSGTTNSQGQYFRYLGRFSDRGIWTVKVTTIKDGYLDGCYETTFEVQY